MNLLVDIGNTLCKWALSSKQGIIEKGFTVVFDSCFIESLQAKGKQFDTIIVCSVRTLSEGLEEHLATHFAYQRIQHAQNLPLKISYDSPETLGMDRVVAAIGARTLLPNTPLLVIDAGTAITIDYLSEDGEFLGGNISPGISLRYKSLHDYTDRLPLVKVQKTFDPIGKNTQSAIRAGVQQGLTHELRGYIRQARKIHDKLQVVLTGGDAPILNDWLKEKLIIEKELVFIGLQYIASNR